MELWPLAAFKPRAETLEGALDVEPSRSTEWAADVRWAGLCATE